MIFEEFDVWKEGKFGIKEKSFQKGFPLENSFEEEKFEEEENT